MMDYWEWVRERLLDKRADDAFWELVRVTEELGLYEKDE